MATQVGSQAVDRASALLTLVVESGGPRTFTSLVDELGLAKSTTSRLLQALERSRLVQRDHAGAFRPGALFSLYAARPSALHDLAELARPTLERLGELSEETVNLAVPRGSEMVQIAQVDSRFVVGATNWVGVDVPSHCTALGKVLLAYRAGGVGLPEEMTSFTRRTVVTPAELRPMLDRVREKGWGEEVEEHTLGAAAIAAPIRGYGGLVVGAIGISGPVERVCDSHYRPRANLVGFVREAARAVSRDLGAAKL